MQTATKSPKTITEASPFNKEQLKHLYWLFNQAPFSNSLLSCSLVRTSKSLSALSVHSENCTLWIINSGAFDHMRSLSNLFSTYSPCPSNQKIKIADGSFSFIVGKGSTPISKILTLESVLHVLNLSFNLLSISKLPRDMNCVAKFFPSYCEFQDLCLGKTIGSAKEIDELYYLVEDPIKSR